VSELRFDGRAVLVTGAGRGIGREYALLLAARGARVLVADVGTDLFGAGSDADPAEQVVTRIRAAGGTARAYVGDLAEEDGARDAVRATVSAFGRIDGLVHNAGFTLGGRRFEEDSLERLDALLAVNARAAFALTQEAWPHLVAQRFGRIVLTTSTAVYGMAGSVAYATAKAALIGLTRTLAEAGAESGIVVNAVSPSAATRMSRNLAPSPFRDWFLQTMRPELVAPLVAVLLHETTTCAGELFVVGGGRVARTVLAETRGVLDQTGTPEQLAAHLTELLADTDFEYPRSTAESGALAARLLGADLQRVGAFAAGSSPERSTGRTT
jgi:NAD(P)-dependent dehydrogenase (short-subunit alcohol dehydrogenase family)